MYFMQPGRSFTFLEGSAAVGCGFRVAMAFLLSRESWVVCDRTLDPNLWKPGESFNLKSIPGRSSGASAKGMQTTQALGPAFSLLQVRRPYSKSPRMSTFTRRLETVMLAFRGQGMHYDRLTRISRKSNGQIRKDLGESARFLA